MVPWTKTLHAKVKHINNSIVKDILMSVIIIASYKNYSNINK